MNKEVDCQGGGLLESGKGGLPTDRVKSYWRESLLELWERPQRQVPALDAIRAAAVLLVILSHFYSIFWAGTLSYPTPAMAESLLFYYGWTGVDLFFILSGYLIGKQLWREKQASGTVDLWRFMLKRGLRIWPLYYFMILLGFTTGAFQPLLADLLFVSNYAPAGYSRGWTLSTEEQFYIAVPLLLLFTPGIKKLHWYFWILGAVVVSVWISRYYTCHSLLQLDAAACKDRMVYAIHLHNESLVAGLGIALLSILKPGWFERKAPGRVSWTGLAVMAFCFAVAALLYTANALVFNFTAQALVFGSTAFWLLLDRSILSRPASWRIWYPISRLSYGMYLNHFVLFNGFIAWFVTGTVERTGSLVIGSWVGIAVGLVVSTLFAVVTFVLVERPFLLLREHWLAAKGRRRTGGTEASGQSEPSPVGIG